MLRLYKKNKNLAGLHYFCSMIEKPYIYIIGAGVSGLTAAITLHKNGYNPVILEKSNHVGGRLRTTVSNGIVMDHGFQVLLESYPGAQEFLDLAALEPTHFTPGSMIFKDGTQHKLGDPRRDSSLLFGTLTAGVGSLKDKWLVFTLSRKLTQKSLTAIFETPEVTTLAYLKAYGFSDTMINDFFKPFYTGIFLESELATSSRMFEFVFKMFSTGSALLPKKGIQAIAQQLAAQIPVENIQLNTAVQSVVGDTITLENGTQIKADYVILATAPGSLVPNLPDTGRQWQSVTNLYFETDHTGFDMPIIGLIANEECLVNNFHFMHDVIDGHKNVLSATVVKTHTLSKEQLAQRVTKELREQANIKVGELIQTFTIPQALPVLESLNYAIPTTETQLTNTIYLAGDYLSNGSLNAAMLNGKHAALAVSSHIADFTVAALPVV